jgi:hypothetical protein
MPKGKILMGKKPPKPGPKPGDPMFDGRPVPGLGIKPKPGKPKPGIPKPKPVQPRANKKNETVTVYSKLAPMSKKPGKGKPVMPRRGGK